MNNPTKYVYLIEVSKPGPADQHGRARGLTFLVTIRGNGRRLLRFTRKELRGDYIGSTAVIYRMPVHLYRDGRVWDFPTFRYCSDEFARVGGAK